VLFYLFPEFIIQIFSGKTIPEASNILFYLGIATSFLSIANLILLYKLSLGKIKGYFHLLVFVLAWLFVCQHICNFFCSAWLFSDN